MPNNALKAGSTLPPLAARTALTTLGSMEGKASLNVISACSCVLVGLGGLEGGVSSFGGGFGIVSIFAVDGLEVVPVS